jgi:hypothetical protein
LALLEWAVLDDKRCAKRRKLVVHNTLGIEELQSAMSPHPRVLAATLALVAEFVFATEWRTLECRVTDGAYGSPGTTMLGSAAKRDPTIIGTTFTVERGADRVVGSSLFQTDRRGVEKVQDVEGIYELLWRNEHRDVFALRLAKFDGVWSFSYFSGWQALLLVGSCRER